MPADWIVEITRKVCVAVPASSEKEAVEMALDIAWEWNPYEAERGDQGEVATRVVRAGDLPGGTPAKEETGG